MRPSTVLKEMNGREPMQQQAVRQSLAGSRFIGQMAVYPQVDLEMVRRFDPLAASPLAQDHASYHFFKRALDVAVSGFALVVVSPVIALISVLVLIESGTPLFLVEKRVGARRWSRGGYAYWRRAIFDCYRFRTVSRRSDSGFSSMVSRGTVADASADLADEELDSGLPRGSVGDPVVTGLGRLLRSHGLDGLPQLWHVLRGDMSLVGPRPATPREVARYDPHGLQRLEAKPGLTGLWRGEGGGSTDVAAMARLDVRHSEQLSLWVDLKALVQTRVEVLAGRNAGQVAKRAIDLVACLLTLPLTVPLMSLCLLIIRIESPGPGLFVQERVGRDGRRFRMYKFRTLASSFDDSAHRAFMKAFVRGEINNGDNERETNPGRAFEKAFVRQPVGDNGGHKIVNKPVLPSQVTRVGRVLRNTSLDELPQVFNVIRGEMSLVGPRPNVPWEVQAYRSWHRRRLEVLPGITGLAQIRGRSGLSFDRIVEHDIEYIDQWSVALDLRILWRTLAAVFDGKGAG